MKGPYKLLRYHLDRPGHVHPAYVSVKYAVIRVGSRFVQFQRIALPGGNISRIEFSRIGSDGVLGGIVVDEYDGCSHLHLQRLGLEGEVLHGDGHAGRAGWRRTHLGGWPEDR
jgi:hypothetical protein